MLIYVLQKNFRSLDNKMRSFMSRNSWLIFLHVVITFFSNSCTRSTTRMSAVRNQLNTESLFVVWL